MVHKSGTYKSDNLTFNSIHFQVKEGKTVNFQLFNQEKNRLVAELLLEEELLQVGEHCVQIPIKTRNRDGTLIYQICGWSSDVLLQIIPVHVMHVPVEEIDTQLTVKKIRKR